MDSLPMVRGLISSVFCADAGAIADWLVDVLGFVERNGGRKAKTGGPGSWVGFLVDDVDAIFQRLANNGVDLDPPRTRDHGVREITVIDPEGHSWGFVQRRT